jgi:shikimate dehydrogenase
MTHARLPMLAGLIGWPVAQSKSPIIHNFWLAKLGLDGEYIRFPVRPGEAEGALRAMVMLGLAGVQATMPHKRACYDGVDELSDEAKALGAVNTVVVLPDGRLRGHNTDMCGFLEPLVGIDLAGKTVTVLGAGGAAAAITVGIASKRPARINLINRSPAGLDQLLGDIAGSLDGIEICRGDWSQTAAFAAESALLANATSLGMAGYPDLPINVADLPSGAIVYDIITHPHETRLLKAAKARGLTCYDGIDMLIGQADEAFGMFYGQAAPREHDAELRALLTA